MTDIAMVRESIPADFLRPEAIYAFCGKRIRGFQAYVILDSRTKNRILCFKTRRNSDVLLVQLRKNLHCDFLGQIRRIQALYRGIEIKDFARFLRREGIKLDVACRPDAICAPA